MEHVYEAWPKIFIELRKAKHILLLADYDGTLTPIVERPEMAIISGNIEQLLQAITDQKSITLGIISGRSLADLKTKIKLRGVFYAGNHGIEIEGPGLNFVAPGAEEIRPLLQSIAMLLSQAVELIPGVFVENKGFSLSVHYRLMPEDKAYDLKVALDTVMDRTIANEKFKLTIGKKVYEVKPEIDWDKGKAISLLMSMYSNIGNHSDVLPVYLGDDVTDEDGFRAIEQIGYGITIHIGNNIYNTVADYFLRSPDESLEFLRILLENSKRGFM